MRDLYEDSNEEALHRQAISALADETRQPVTVVTEVYEREYAELKASARVKDYLPLFAARRARKTLGRGPAPH
jgi:hypothetical protein